MIEEDWGVYFLANNDSCEILVSADYGDGVYVYEANYGKMLDFTLNITDPTASIPSLDLAHLNIYPNPVGNQLNIDYKDVISQVSVKDMYGGVIDSHQLYAHNNSIAVDHLRTGTYLLKIQSETQEISIVKFVKK